MFKKLLGGLLALAAVAAPTAALADYSRGVRVMNFSNSSYIVRLTATNEHGRTYDVLSGMSITPGYNRYLSFNDGEGHNHCLFYVKAIFANGVQAARTLNVCTATNWRIFDLDNDVQ